MNRQSHKHGAEIAAALNRRYQWQQPDQSLAALKAELSILTGEAAEDLEVVVLEDRDHLFAYHTEDASQAEEILEERLEEKLVLPPPRRHTRWAAVGFGLGMLAIPWIHMLDAALDTIDLGFLPF